MSKNQDVVALLILISQAAQPEDGEARFGLRGR